MQRTQERTDQLLEQQLQKAWEKDREVWRTEWVGARRGGAAARGAVSRAQLQHQQQGSIVQPLMAAGTTPSRPYGTNTPLSLATIGTGTGTNSTVPPALSSTGSLYSTTQQQQLALDPALVQAHLTVLQDMQQADTAIIHKFVTATIPTHTAPLSPVHAGYRSAWQLATQLVSTAATNQATGRLQACATLEHLSKQFHATVQDQIRAHPQHALCNRYTNDLANQCATFCELTVPNNNNDSNHAWPIVYMCLRCGNAAAALQVYQQDLQTTHRPQDPALSEFLPTLADASSVAQALRVAPPAPRPVLGTVTNESIFQQAVYALVSANTETFPTQAGMSGLSTLEDHLAYELWRALLLPDDNNSNDPAENCSAALVQLSRNIRNYGPDYFGNGSSGGWAYAQPLLLTLQYASALEHLVQVGGPTGLMQATHLALVLSTAGVVLQDYTGEEKSTTPKDSLVASLLVTYAQALLTNFGSRAAVEYLARIPNRRQARSEVAKLIATAGDLQGLVGGVNADGVRDKKGQTIDLHFSKAEIESLLSQAAEMLLNNRGAATAASNDRSLGLAVMCYMLAERYADVVGLLNQALCPPDQPDEFRAKWMSELADFRQRYLSSRPTHVLHVLESQGQMAVVETSHILSELNAFFQQYRDGHFEQAWKTVQALQLLPQSSSDLTAREHTYRQLDPLVQQAFPAVLQACMDMLYREHRYLKVDQSLNNPVARERTGEIQAKAKLLVTLAGLLGLPQADTMSRLESLMI